MTITQAYGYQSTYGGNGFAKHFGDASGYKNGYNSGYTSPKKPIGDGSKTGFDASKYLNAQGVKWTGCESKGNAGAGWGYDSKCDDKPGYTSPVDNPKTPKNPTDPVDPTPPTTTEQTLPDGLQAGGPTTIADNQGNSLSVFFDVNGAITEIQTTRRQVETRDANGEVESFSAARFRFDADAQPVSATSSISFGQPPVEPEPTGETIAFPQNDVPQPVLNNDGFLVGFADQGFDDQNGAGVQVILDANGDITGFRLTERAPVGGDLPFTDIRIRDFDLDGTLIAEAQS